MIQAALLMAVLQQAATTGSGDDAGSVDPLAGLLPPAVYSIAAPAADPLLPGSVFTVPEGPRIARIPAPGSQLVAIRVSVPVRETPAEAGAARILQELAMERLQRANSAGVSIQGARTPRGIAYTLVGALADFDLLARLAREAVADPRAGEWEFESRRMALRSDVLRTHETPAARLTTELRGRAAPDAVPPEGTPASLDRITRVSMRELWARTHRPPEMTVVVAGDIDDEDILAAFGGMDAPPPAPDPPEGSLAQAPVRGTQVLRHWLGLAFPVVDPRDPHAPVAAVLIAAHLRTAGDPFETDVQLWETDGAKVLTVLAAAYPGDAVRMRSRLPTVLSDTRQGLSAERVRAAVAEVRHEMLVGARTPGGLVALVGRYLDATGDPGAARLFLDALDGVTLASVRSYLAALEARPPLSVQVRP